MRRQIGDGIIELVKGDITREEVDAIANAANCRLAGGGGVDGAIHRRGGPAIMQETGQRYPEGCPTGSAVISGAGNLRAKYVLHAVGPVWSGGSNGEPALLAGAYRTCLELARDHACASVAFPAISAGIYGYPMHLAASVALETTRSFLQQNAHPSLIRFVLFDVRAFTTFSEVLQELESDQ